MKVIKVVALVAIAVAIVVYAAPFAGSLAALYGASAGVVAAITSAVVGMGISLGMSAAMSAFRKAPSISQASGDRLVTNPNPSAPRKIVFGRTAGGNDLCFVETYGTKKDRESRVQAVASHRVHNIESFVVETTPAWTNGVIQHQGLESFRAVTEGSAANARAVGTGLRWTASSTFTGCSYIALTWRIDPKVLPQGIPARTVTIVEGCPLYDPRLDSANGGSGSHRPDNQATWEYYAGGTAIGRNPALALLTYLIGYRINGVLVWGRGVPLSRINLDSFRTYANICEEAVTLQGGGTVQRYTIDGIFSTADSHESIIGAITACMGSCKLNDVGGQYQLIGGYDDTAGPKIDFDESDLIGPPGSPIPYQWKPAQTLSNCINVIRGRYADPAQQYQLVDWGTVKVDPEADGVTRTMQLDFGAVSRAETCQRIAKQFLLREKLTPGIFTATFGPKAFATQVGSLITLSHPDQGWNKKLFRVQDQAETIDLVFQMTLREESPEVYAWDREEKPLPSKLNNGTYDPTSTLTLQDFRLNTRVYEGV